MKPKTRLENFLAKIAGSSDAKEMEPKTRVEHFLNDIAQSGGGSGGGAGVFWVNITSPDGGTTWTADKTVDEVIAAVYGGKMVYANFDGQYVPFVSSFSVADEDYRGLTFAALTPNNYDSGAKKLFIDSTRIEYSAEGTTTNLTVESGFYSFSVSKIG